MSMFVMPVAQHNEIVSKAYQARGYLPDESTIAAQVCAQASWHGIRTHNAIKALHLDELFGAKPGGCVPGAKVEKLSSRFAAVEKWNANFKLGQVIAYDAMNRAAALADEYGTGTIVVDNAFHYLWGGGYVIEMAKRGYIAYTNCTTTLAEVVPFGGKYPTIGTNPHSWAFPTQDILGFPICIDWATSKIAMGKVQQLKREGKKLPPECAIGKDGKMTIEPEQVLGLLPFGDHKGYGLSLLDELYGAFIGGSIPTRRGHFEDKKPGEKQGMNMVFQITHPEALNCGAFANGASQLENVKTVLSDILAHGNSGAKFPGQIEAEGAALSEKHGGLLFTEVEVKSLAKLAKDGGVAFDPGALRVAPV